MYGPSLKVEFICEIEHTSDIQNISRSHDSWESDECGLIFLNSGCINIYEVLT